MLTLPGWILFIVGILFILIGGGLLVYSSLSRRETRGARAAVDEGILKTILDFAMGVLKLIADKLPPDKISQVGFIILIFGIVLVLLPFLIPGLQQIPAA